MEGLFSFMYTAQKLQPRLSLDRLLGTHCKQSTLKGFAVTGDP